MKTLVFLFAPANSLYKFDKLFDGKSAFERSLEWAESMKKLCESEICVLTEPSEAEKCRGLISEPEKVLVVEKNSWTITELFDSFCAECEKTKADTIIFAWADCPFLNLKVTKEMLSVHKEFIAEYTYADGYADGLCPEVLDSGAAKILLELSKKQEESKVIRTGIFDLLKTDINSFDVETVIAENDAGLFRIHFDCGTKQTALCCKEMFALGVEGKNADEISEAACKSVKVLKTLPSYYSIQITDRVNSRVIYHPDGIEDCKGKEFMALDNFKKIIDTISDFSETAVVSLSAWGEALLHPDFEEMLRYALSKTGLTVLIEGELLSVSEDLCQRIKNIPASAERIIWISCLDSFTPETYCLIHKGAVPENFEQAKETLSVLAKYFPDSVYAQFVRMNENEEELEAFYKFWSAKTSPSNGKIIVQKYDNFCGLLPDRKPADLSPLERNACWHIRRDITILCDGSVPFCRARGKADIVGNILSDKPEMIWKMFDSEVQNHLCGKYSGKCGNCDEYYTFNF